MTGDSFVILLKTNLRYYLLLGLRGKGLDETF